MKRLLLLTVVVVAGTCTWSHAAEAETALEGDLVAQKEKDKAPAKNKTPPAKKDETPATPATTAASALFTGRTEGMDLPRNRAPEMLGDQGSAGRPRPVPVVTPVPVPGPITNRIGGIVPGPRDFKIAENESPRPQDRVYFSFNFYDDILSSLNRSFNTGLNNPDAYRNTFGVEKTFLDGMGSIGLRLPLNTFHGNSSLDPELNGTSNALGDLSVILKLALYGDAFGDNWFVSGLAVTPTTGPDAFAGLAGAAAPHSTALQPFVGYLWNTGNCYVQGFSSIDVPTGSGEATLMFNDIAVGVYLYRNPGADSGLTAVAPTFEVHVLTPLDSRNTNLRARTLGAVDIVDLTTGVNLEFNDRRRLAVGVCVPATGPRPFNVEALAQLRCRF